LVIVGAELAPPAGPTKVGPYASRRQRRPRRHEEHETVFEEKELRALRVFVVALLRSAHNCGHAWPVSSLFEIISANRHQVNDRSPTNNQERSRSALETSLALLETMFDSTHDGILVLDLNRNVIRFNRRFLKMFGFTAEQMEQGGLDGTVAALADQLENAELLLGNAQRFFTDSGAEIVDSLRFKDGRVYERFVAPHRVNGKVVGIVASYHDISQAVRTEQALQYHRAFLEKAQEVAHIGSWVAELDGSQQLGWSKETHQILGVPLGESSTRLRAMSEFVHPDDRDAIRRASAAAIADNEPYDVEHRIIRGDGAVRWVHTKADVMRNEAGKPLRMIGTIQDVTDRRLLEEQLRQAQKLEAIGRLAGGIAHDLNNALTAIVGYTELALGALADGHPARPDVQEIRRAGERAESVTRQLLAFSRKQLLEPRIFYVNDSVANLGRMLERLLGSGVELKTNIADGLPPIYGDPGQIEQAIINLAVNARDAMPEGGRLTLGVSMAEVDEAFAQAHQPMTPGRYLELSVMDTGEGMDPETQAHIFEPFFTTKDVGKGTGLGLAMVYGTVKQSGGYIFLESAPGKGTTFRLYFHPAPKQEMATATTKAGEAPTKRTVLVAEDEAAVRNLVVTALKKQGFRVLPASTGEEALRLGADEPRIDLLLSDANMPGISGIELARLLIKNRPNLPVIIMSGYTDETLSIDGAREPVVLLPKPFTPKDIRQKVELVLRRAI